MPTFDSTAKSAIDSAAFAPAYFIFCDISGDPLRLTTFGQDVTFSGTGDSDLDGFTFSADLGQLIDIGDIGDAESGGDSFTIRLSGLLGPDNGLMNDIGNKSLWQGRLCRAWMRVYDESGVTAQGAIVPLDTTYMSSVRFVSEPTGQVIELTCEKYLSFYSDASNRTYLSQKDYDSGDNSAAATIAAANGMRRDTGAGSAPVGPTPAPPDGSGGLIPSPFTNPYGPYPDNIGSDIPGADLNFN